MSPKRANSSRTRSRESSVEPMSNCWSGSGAWVEASSLTVMRATARKTVILLYCRHPPRTVASAQHDGLGPRRRPAQHAVPPAYALWAAHDRGAALSVFARRAARVRDFEALVCDL